MSEQVVVAEGRRIRSTPQRGIREAADVGRSWATAALVLLVILAPLRAFAQVAGATLSGSIADQQGDVIAGATVSIKNVASGVVTDVVTNTSGVYTAPNLLPGAYEVTAALSGFATVVRTGIMLTVGAQRTVDITMSVGPVTETVTVETPNVDNTTPTLSAVVGERTIVELPLNGRDWTALATLQPGVSSIRTQFASGGTASRGNRGYGDSLSIAGHRPQENNYRIDGVSINDYSNGAPGSAGGLNLGADAIREFSVLVTNYTAEYGRTSGGVINATTRSGTNAFRGSAYEFHRNDALDERGFFDPPSKPELNRHQFGAALGGPIIRNRTFFFAAYEGIRRTQGVTSIATVPSAAARRGELAAGRVTVDPAIVPFLAFWPQANGPLLGNGDTAAYTTILDQDLTEDFVTARIDHQISSGNTLSATYMFDEGEFTVPDALNNVSFPNTARRQLAAAEWTRTFSPRFVNSIRFGFSQTKGGVNLPGPAFNPVAEDTSLGSAPGRPAAILQVPGVTSAIAVGGNSFFDHTQNSYQAYDDAFLSLGQHALKMGLAFERIEYDLFGLRRQNGLAAFGSLSAFLTNRPTSFFALDPSRSQEAQVRSSILAAYVDDHWRVTPKLSLNLGLRYEVSTVPKEAQGRFTAVRDLAGGPILNVDSFFTKNPTLGNLQPRVGFAYDVFGNGRTAVRGGFGVYDSLPLPWIFTPKVAQGTPFNVGTTVRNLEQGAFPARIFGRINFNTVAGDSLFVETEPKRSYVMNWNVSVQHQVLSGLTAMVAYVGSRGNNQAFVTDDSNIVAPIGATPEGLGIWPSPAGSGTTVDPRAGSLRTNTWDGTNRYQGLQTQISQQLKRGFQAQASYTWSRCTDDGSGASRNDQFLNGITTPIFFDQSKRRGRCDFDLTHVFVANALWNLPGPQAGLAKALLADWQLGAIVSASSGVPFSVIMSGDPLGLKGLDVNGWPDVVNSPGCRTLTNPGNHEHYLKTECFAVPNPITRLGNAGRNIVTGPGLFTVDLAVYKNIPFSETTRMQFRAEAFNVFNRVNFAAPLSNNAVFNQTGGALGNAGRITATQTPPRQIQLGLRLNW